MIGRKMLINNHPTLTNIEKLNFNTSNKADHENQLYGLDHPSNYMASICSGIIGTVGVVGNVPLLIFLAIGIMKRRPHELLIFNLALIDTCLCLNTGINEAYFILHYESIGCKLTGFIDYFLGGLSFTQPPLVMLNRCISVYKQDLYKKLFTKKNTIFVCSLAWFIHFCVILPFIFFDATGLDDLGICGTRIINWYLKGIFIILLSCMLCNYILSAFCCYKFIAKIKDHASNEGSHVQSRLIEESKQIMTLMGILLIIPLFAQLPSVIIKFTQMFITLDPWISRPNISIFVLPSMCNPYLTILTIKEYKRKVKSFFKKENKVLNINVNPAVLNDGAVSLIQPPAKSVTPNVGRTVHTTVM